MLHSWVFYALDVCRYCRAHISWSSIPSNSASGTMYRYSTCTLLTVRWSIVLDDYSCYHLQCPCLVFLCCLFVPGDGETARAVQCFDSYITACNSPFSIVILCILTNGWPVHAVPCAAYSTCNICFYGLSLTSNLCGSVSNIQVIAYCALWTLHLWLLCNLRHCLFPFAFYVRLNLRNSNRLTVR